MGVAVSRLRYGQDQWEPASLLWDAPDRNDHTTAMWTDETGKIYHFQGVSEASWFRYLALFCRTSTDNGVTWSEPIWISRKHQPCQMNCESVFRTRSGSIVLATDSRYSGDPARSAIWVSDDDGLTWYNPAPRDDKGLIGGIHACVVELDDGRLMAYGRGGEVNGTMPKSISADMGQSWTIGSSQFPGIGSRQRSVLLRLKEGPILLVSFDSDGIFATVSLDEGQTWKPRRYLTSETKTYLAGKQSPDGVIHIVASIINQHYSFNLKWVYSGYNCP
jgi:sulfatase modifying factor 1